MKKSLQLLVAIFLLGSLTVQPEPFFTWDYQPSTTYMSGESIPGNDLQTWRLLCNDTPFATGLPRDIEVAITDPSAPPSREDMAPVVRGRLGDFECVVIQHSALWNTDSDASDPWVFTVTPEQLGKVPGQVQNLTAAPDPV